MPWQFLPRHFPFKLFWFNSGQFPFKVLVWWPAGAATVVYLITILWPISLLVTVCICALNIVPLFWSRHWCVLVMENWPEYFKMVFRIFWYFLWQLTVRLLQYWEHFSGHILVLLLEFLNVVVKKSSSSMTPILRVVRRGSFVKKNVDFTHYWDLKLRKYHMETMNWVCRWWRSH